MGNKDVSVSLRLVRTRVDEYANIHLCITISIYFNYNNVAIVDVAVSRFDHQAGHWIS